MLFSHQAIPVVVEKHNETLQIILGEASVRKRCPFEKRLQLLGCHSFVRVGAGRLCPGAQLLFVEENHTAS